MGTQAANRVKKTRTKRVLLPEPAAPRFLLAEGPVPLGAEGRGGPAMSWDYCVVTLCWRHEVFYSTSGAAYLRTMVGDRCEECPIVLGYVGRDGVFREEEL